MRSYLVLALSFVSVLIVATAPADGQAHRGQMDTDGRLSPGEIPNPRIRYGYHPYAGSGYDSHGWDKRRDDRYAWHDRDNYHSSWDGGHSGDVLGGSFYDGLRNGRISRDEERELRDSAADLRRRESDYRRDGRLSDRERDDLEDRQDDLRKKLQHELYDGEKRSRY